MRWTMPNVKVAAALVLLVAAETVIAAGGGGGGGGGGRQRGAATATAADRQPGTVASSGDKSSQTPATGAERQRDAAESPQIPAAVPCSSCLAHESIRSLSLELIKMSILNKLGMQRPPEFGGRRPPKVPTDLPPLQDLMRKYNNDRGSPMMVMPHIRHKSHHYESSGDGGGGFGSDNMQSDEAASYAAAAAASIMDSGGSIGGGGGGGGDDDEDDYHVKTHKLIAFAQPHPTTPKLKGSHLLYFTFSEQTGQRRITEAILWLYKKRSDLIAEDALIVIEVHRVHPGTNHQTLVSNVKRVLNTTEPGWVPIDLQKRMADWFRTSDGAKNLTLSVNAHYSAKNMTHAKMPFVTDARKRDDMTEIPYLEVHTADGRRSRSKRSGMLGMDCDETSNEPLCCRYPLTVDFEEFGWDWIIAPKKYEANYCSGECPLEFLQKYPHTHLAQLTNKTGGYPGTGPCCAPRKLSAISMLYFDEDSNIIYGLLPGMVVNKCGCS